MLQYKKLPKQLSHFTKENILSTTHPIFCNIDHLLYDVHKNIFFEWRTLFTVMKHTL